MSETSFCLDFKVNEQKVQQLLNYEVICVIYTMDILLTQGFLHLAEDIFELLDDSSLVQARAVCKRWKWVIERQKWYWKRIVRFAKLHRICQSEEWIELIETMESHQRHNLTKDTLT